MATPPARARRSRFIARLSILGWLLWSLAGCGEAGDDGGAPSVFAAPSTVSPSDTPVSPAPGAGPSVPVNVDSPSPSPMVPNQASPTPTAGQPAPTPTGDTLDAGVPAPDAGGLEDAAAPVADPIDHAGALDGLFIDAKCEPNTPLPLAMGATCNHPPGTQRIEQSLTFGGDPATTYDVTLRVRGIWEPTSIQGGHMPKPSEPFTVGGQVAGGSAIDYQQYSIEVSSPNQTYWLNNHGYLAHDIHKVDYEATIQVQGGASVKVVMNDGNEREIANWTKDYFDDLPPYDTAPSIGQTLHLDVLAVSE